MGTEHRPSADVLSLLIREIYQILCTIRQYQLLRIIFMKINSTLAQIFTLFLLMACSKNSGDNPTPPNNNTDPSTPTEEKLEIRISPSFNTRATDFGFETNDCIGLYVVNYNGDTPGQLLNSGNHVDNMRFTYSGSWTPDSPIYWKDVKTFTDFYLYYPYSQVTSVTAHPFTVNADQSTDAAFKASDFMVGKAVKIAPTSFAVVIPASHVMSRIQIQIEPGNGFTKEDLAKSNIAVKINGLKTGASVNFTNSAVTATGNPVTVTPLYADGNYRALIVPQTVAEQNLISVTVDGSEFVLRKGFTFESGKSYMFTVTVSKTTNGINVNINPWDEDGVDYGGVAE